MPQVPYTFSTAPVFVQGLWHFDDNLDDISGFRNHGYVRNNDYSQRLPEYVDSNPLQRGQYPVDQWLIPTPLPTPTPLPSQTPSPTPLPTPQPSPSPTPSPVTMTLDNNIVVVGTSINVSWNNLSSGVEKDWVAMFKQSDPSTAQTFKEWLFLGSCSKQSQARIPGSSGSCGIKVPDNLPVGVYELRMMTNNTYNVVATSQSLIVGGGDNFIVAADPNPVKAGQTVNLSWSGITTFKQKDWVGMFKVNDPASAGYLKEWIFLSTCSRQPRTDSVPHGPAGNCTLTIPANLSEGEYNFRFMTDNLYQVIGTTRNITVTR